MRNDTDIPTLLVWNLLAFSFPRNAEDGEKGIHVAGGKNDGSKNFSFVSHEKLFYLFYYLINIHNSRVKFLVF